MSGADELAMMSPFSRREWAAALDIMGTNSEVLLPTVHGLCSLGWSPSGAASKLVALLPPAEVSR